VTWRFSGRITKELPGAWSAAAVGRSFSIVGTSTVWFTSDGLVGHIRDYWNLVALLTQLGELTL
jgi:hypothetical protein